MTHCPKVPALPGNEILRQVELHVIDQRQQQIDPAGRHRTDPNRRNDGNRKQPGGSSDRSPPETSTGD
ncbi:hypothetical protein [Szabonella alba]|uniref:Uncharacterized protein n=1 Tax=Szabonella alba TaxID=2804194 RepID=A0A8K0VBZ6_9RHOB|nr:hypothetical protein [Szabonella alba]MBL4918911.1 hypothetical protein [Szabonella alba]